LIIYPVTYKEEKYKTHIFVSNRASNNRTKIDDDTIKEILDADSQKNI